MVVVHLSKQFQLSELNRRTFVDKESYRQFYSRNFLCREKISIKYSFHYFPPVNVSVYEAENSFKLSYESQQQFISVSNTIKHSFHVSSNIDKLIGSV